MKFRSRIRPAIAAVVSLSVAGASLAAPLPDGACDLPRPLTFFCQVFDLLHSPLEALIGGGESGPSTEEPSDPTSETTSTTPTEEATGSEPGDGSTELRPDIDPDG